MLLQIAKPKAASSLSWNIIRVTIHGLHLRLLCSLDELTHELFLDFENFRIAEFLIDILYQLLIESHKLRLELDLLSHDLSLLQRKSVL